jgi:hypothetical protein
MLCMNRKSVDKYRPLVLVIPIVHFFCLYSLPRLLLPRRTCLMKKKYAFLFGITFCYQFTLAQSVLKGSVISEENQKPLPSVSVYLDNTSIGTTTNEQGLFILRGIPQGKFRLVITSIGYNTFDSLIDSRKLNSGCVILLKTNTQELEGFSVLPPDPDGWEKYGKYFKALLLGTTQNSNDCQLLNPQVVKFRLNTDNTLSAFAREPLQVTNYALGYDIQYKMEEFSVNLNTGVVSYSGFAFYKDLAITHPKRAGKYAEARLDTYLGSLLHFMRAFYANDLRVQGFEMRSLKMISNPEKDRAKKLFSIYGKSPIVSEAKNDIGFERGYYGGLSHIRTTNYTIDSTQFFKKVLKQSDSIVSHELILPDSVGFAVDSTIAGFYFPDSLEVSYKLKGIPPRYKALSKEHKHETYPISQFVFVNKTPVYIIRNGFYYKPYDIKITGFWAWWENMSTWLPYDYVPNRRQD